MQGIPRRAQLLFGKVAVVAMIRGTCFVFSQSKTQKAKVNYN